MGAEPGVLVACLLIGVLTVVPALQAASRRRQCAEWSEIATVFMDFALSVRRGQCRIRMEDDLLARARRLAIPEMVTFEFVHDLAAPAHDLLADAAQRLGLRLKRRVAFERKMLARTASGRWRGSLAAAAPVAALLALQASGVAVPWAALLLLVVIEALGCWLLWRVSRIEI